MQPESVLMAPVRCNLTVKALLPGTGFFIVGQASSPPVQQPKKQHSPKKHL